MSICACVWCVSFPVLKKLNRCCALKINGFELFQVSEETQDKYNPLGACPYREKEPNFPLVLGLLLPSFLKHMVW